MANIFNSKEIYMHIPRDVHGKETIVPISGLYVVGEYRRPFYIDGHLHISGITSTKTTIKNYTQRDVDMTASAFNILPIEVDTLTSILIDYYTKSEASAPADPVFNILPIDVDTNTAIDIEFYTTNTVDAYSDGTFNILPLEIDVSKAIDITNYANQSFGSMSESSLRIRTITTTKANISDVAS